MNLAMANAKSGKVYDELLAYISEPLFLIPVNSFMDEHCLIFDIDSPTVNEHKEIHKSYKDLICAMLMNFGDEYGKSVEDVINIVKELDKISDIHIMFETSIRFVYASEDFELFCTVMARRNITIQEQVLALILSIKGVLPESLRRGPSVVKRDQQMISADEKEVENLVAEDMLSNSQAGGEDRSIVMSNIDIKELEENQRILTEKMKKLILKEKQLHGDYNKKDEDTEIDRSYEAKTSQVLDEKMSNPEELKERQEFLRMQRDKLLKMRKVAREKNMNKTNDESSAIKSLEQKSEQDPIKVDKNLALRRTIAEKLRQEVIGKK